MENQEYNNTPTSKQEKNEEKLYGLYDENLSSEIKSFFTIADDLNSQINTLKVNNPELWNTILQKLKIDWTYNSNSIEGSTLTRGETHFFFI